MNARDTEPKGTPRIYSWEDVRKDTKHFDLIKEETGLAIEKIWDHYFYKLFL